MLLHSFTECCKHCCMYTPSFQSYIHAIYTCCHCELCSCHIDGKKWYCAFFFLLSAPFVHSGRNSSVLPDQNYCRFSTKKSVHTRLCGVRKKKYKVYCLFDFLYVNIRIKVEKCENKTRPT